MGGKAHPFISESRGAFVDRRAAGGCRPFSDSVEAVLDRCLEGSVVTAIAGLLDRCAELKREMLEFSWQPRFDRDRSEVLRDHLPDRFVGDESELIVALDYFLLQHELRSGKTVVERFVANRPDLPEHERELLLGWRDVVEGMFEVHGRDGDALVREPRRRADLPRVLEYGTGRFPAAETRRVHDRPTRTARVRVVGQRQLRVLSEE